MVRGCGAEKKSKESYCVTGESYMQVTSIYKVELGPQLGLHDSARLRSCDRDRVAHRAEDIDCRVLYRKVADP